MADDASAVRVFSAAEDPAAAEQCCICVSKSFATEPNNGLLCPDPARFAERWYAIAANSLKRSPAVPMLHTLGVKDFSAVAFAYSYPEHKVPDDAPEPEGVIDLSASSRPEGTAVRDDLLAFMADRKAAFLREHGPFEYIAFLATLPDRRGKGLGARLLRHVTDKADSLGRWCYLEATNSDNARLYARHGFRELESKVWTLPETAPGERLMLILMARPPASESA